MVTGEAAKVFATIMLMSERDRAELHRQLCRFNLTDRQKLELNGHAERSGRTKATDHCPAELALTRILEAEDATGLTPEYVRAYIRMALDLCPSDFFRLAPDGDWCIDPEEFASLPRAIRVLVEGVETRYVNGKPIVKVKFVSKDHALRLAAQYTLTQRIAVAQVHVPWDKFCEVNAEDNVESRLRIEEADGVSAQRTVVPEAG